jgi:gag-polyprotein putative aspartyl protease
LDNLVAAGYAYLKSTRGRPFADEVGIPFWRLRQACQSDPNCIRERQIEAISAYQAAGAPVSLPYWLGQEGTYNGANSALGTQSPSPPAVATLAPPIGSPDATIVPMLSDGGTFVVPVTINGQLTLKFVIDSGAADVSVPADVVLTLLRTDTISDSDFLGNQTYKLADGSTVPSQRFVIRSLKVGDKTLESVVGSIAPVSGSLLLGQSFLSRFRSWSIDNRRQALILN